MKHRQVVALLRQVKGLAGEYRRLTGKPLGVTGEIGEFEAARLLGVELTPARQSGYDATEKTRGGVRRLQIKSRCIPEWASRAQRLGGIRTDRQWDGVLMVILDENLNAVEIYEAQRRDILRALKAPGSRARNERGALPVSKFKSIGRRRWPVP